MDASDPIHQAFSQLTVQFATIIVLIGTTLLASIGAVAVGWLTRLKNDLLEKKLDQNTLLTAEGIRKVTEVKSDVKEAKDTAVDAANAAQIAKAQSAISTQVATNLTRDIGQKVDDVKGVLQDTREALNGRTTEFVKAARAEGLAEGLQLHDGITTRIEKLEGGHEVLVQGQVEVIRSIGRLMEEVQVIGKDVKAQSKHD